jgi:Fe-S cluster assembly ATP-binding protein
MIDICAGNGVDTQSLARSLNFEDFLERDLNEGFSGGEIKRSELLQLIAQDPDLLLFDEPESGVDIENMSLIGKTIARVLQKTPPEDTTKPIAEQRRERSKMGLIITHTGYILDYVPADKGQVLYDGVIACAGNAHEIFACIGKAGYEECIKCAIR